MRFMAALAAQAVANVTTRQAAQTPGCFPREAQKMPTHLVSALGQSSRHARAYRLIDALFRPHPQLDGCYGSLEEALQDAVTWLEGLGADGQSCSIGLEVSTPSGDWRTIRQPDLLLCPLRG